MKRFIICFDGTWQRLRQDKPTNIAILARSVAHTNTLEDGTQIPQIVIYSQGVGSNIDALGKDGFVDGMTEWLNKILGGVFGEGVEDNIVETYLRLAFNYEAGDEIYVFGFSRGAFCARSFAGLISSAGIVSRLHAERAWDAFRLYRSRPGPKATQFERDDYDRARREFRTLYGKGVRAADGTRIKSDESIKVTYLGIFDTVGQRGVPSALGGFARSMNKRFGFHDMMVGSNVLAARHAVAIDERRLGFPATLWEGVEVANQRPHCQPGRVHYQQRWFVGTHGDIGGGEGSPLSAAPLKWIAEGAAECGLRFYGKYGEDESPLDQAIREAGLVFNARISRPKFWDSLSPMNYPIYSRRIWAAKARKEQPSADYIANVLDPTVTMRATAKDLRPRYRPAPLKPFENILNPPPLKKAKRGKAEKASGKSERMTTQT
ncbi:MAG: DUF2235 domain-containing protein [Hyphomonadaceae bacterium]|nr:DUF2235 domain-containing protein [Hyphomonadaceae bacterium]